MAETTAGCALQAGFFAACATIQKEQTPPDGRRGGVLGCGEAPGGACGADAYMRSIIALPKPEHETSLAPSIRRAKS